ncbi:MAG: zinc ribbon domain-containing protein [Spirochaetaceae bacterium]|nr:MAG: zinc ribbon domain-containing protein [Spirochaetaceae bacterium]
MPSYDYECKSCGHSFEEFQYMSDAPLKKCPSCGKLSLRRLIGGGMGIIFKGSGFYVNDSRSASRSASDTKKTSPAKSTDAAPSTGTSEAKTA